MLERGSRGVQPLVLMVVRVQTPSFIFKAEQTQGYREPRRQTLVPHDSEHTM